MEMEEYVIILLFTSGMICEVNENYCLLFL